MPNYSRSGRKKNSISRRLAMYQDFTCGHCGLYVSADPMTSGVQNRNHCPYCLWSRHVDFQESGDRLSSCRGMMQPVGLTYKRIKKKYGPEQGELMIIHQCTQCGRLSINRIAADDDVEKILEVFRSAEKIDPETRANIEESEISLLGPAEEALVHSQLFGKNYGASEVYDKADD